MGAESPFTALQPHPGHPWVSLFPSYSFTTIIIGASSRFDILRYGWSHAPSLRFPDDSAVLNSCHIVIPILVTVTASHCKGLRGPLNWQSWVLLALIKLLICFITAHFFISWSTGSPRILHSRHINEEREGTMIRGQHHCLGRLWN